MMNERIREIAEQAGWSGFEALDERNQKFAELIVRECANHIRDSIQTMERGKLRASIAHAATLIEEHFGVEE